MALELTAGSLVRSGSYVVLVAIALMLWARRDAHPWNRRLALGYLFAAVGGMAFNLIGANTLDPPELDQEVVLPIFVFTAACSVAGAIVWWPIVRGMLRDLGPGRPRAAAIAFLALSAAAVTIEAAFFAADGHWLGFEGTAYRGGVMLTATTGLIVASELQRAGRGSVLFWAAVFPAMLEALLYAGAIMAEPRDYTGTAWGAMRFVTQVTVRVVAVVWGLRALSRASDRTWLSLMLALFAAAMAGALLGDRGLTRTGVGGILLVLGNLATLVLLRRLGPLAVPAGRRLGQGSVASIALAALFVTAQVAQNFFSDQYGLYLGGVVAGIVVFAAAPLQKAAERAIENRRRGAGSAVERYRRNVEIAWADGRLRASERLLLRETREALGVDAAAAQQIEDEVAAAALAAKGGPRRKPESP